MATVVRLLAILGLGFYCVTASAAVTCEQLAAIGSTTQQLRDQGNSLSAVMSEISRLETGKNFTAADMDHIKDVVNLTFNGMLSPREVLRECTAGSKKR